MAIPLDRGWEADKKTIERDLCETRPGPQNKEKWAGKRLGQKPKQSYKIHPSTLEVEMEREGKRYVRINPKPTRPGEVTEVEWEQFKSEAHTRGW